MMICGTWSRVRLCSDVRQSEPLTPLMHTIGFYFTRLAVEVLLVWKVNDTHFYVPWTREDLFQP